MAITRGIRLSQGFSSPPRSTSAPENPVEIQGPQVPAPAAEVQPLQVEGAIFFETFTFEEASTVKEKNEQGAGSSPSTIKKKRIRKPLNMVPLRRSKRHVAEPGSPSSEPSKKSKTAVEPEDVDSSSSNGESKKSKTKVKHVDSSTTTVQYSKEDKETMAAMTKTIRELLNKPKETFESREEQSESREEHSESGEDQSESGEDQSESRTEQSESREEQSESGKDQSESRAEQSESGFLPGREYAVDYYSEDAEHRWKFYSRRNCISERKVDLSSFRRYNVMEFLEKRGMTYTVQYAKPYVEHAVKLFYTNMTMKFDVESSDEFGKSYIRGTIYEVTPAKINVFFRRDDLGYELENIVIDEVTTHLSGGTVNVWHNEMKISDLTPLHNVLHKLTTTNWLPTSNNTSVTKDQAVLIYKLSAGLPIDLGLLIFKRIKQEAESSTGRILPYPCLIYQLLQEAGFVAEPGDMLSKKCRDFRISAKYISGDVVDLPWLDLDNPTQIGDQVDSVGENDATYSVPSSFLVEELARCNDQIKFFTEQLHSARQQKSRILHTMSSQQGGKPGGDGNGNVANEERDGPDVGQRSRAEVEEGQMEDEERVEVNG